MEFPWTFSSPALPCGVWKNILALLRCVGGDAATCMRVPQAANRISLRSVSADRSQRVLLLWGLIHLRWAADLPGVLGLLAVRELMLLCLPPLMTQTSSCKNAWQLWAAQAERAGRDEQTRGRGPWGSRGALWINNMGGAVPASEQQITIVPYFHAANHRISSMFFPDFIYLQHLYLLMWVQFTSHLLKICFPALWATQHAALILPPCTTCWLWGGEHTQIRPLKLSFLVCKKSISSIHEVWNVLKMQNQQIP